MDARSVLMRRVECGHADQMLTQLYAGALEDARRRMLRVIEGFQEAFPGEYGQTALFSGPGRTEIGGNHTDHQHGRVLCAGVDLDMLACAAPNGTGMIRICSQGYPPLEVDLEQLSPRSEEKNTSASLVRGIAAQICALGYPVGGFDGWMISDVPAGSGLSSSAAYEVLVGNIINHFFCGGALTAVELARIGQYAENHYFGKPCGLMDQMACSVGGAVFIDFAHPDAPAVYKAEGDFSASGYVLYIVDTGSCHADLTDDYGQITAEMGAVANCFGKTVLGQVDRGLFYRELPRLRQCCTDRAILRAMHFFEDDQRAWEEYRALEEGDFPRFLELVNASGLSSAVHLQNTWSVSAPGQQTIPLALAVGQRLLEGSGAIRVHGGGFAGTIQAFVPLSRAEQFRSGMEQLLGRGCCHRLRIRPIGGCVILTGERDGEKDGQ